MPLLEELRVHACKLRWIPPGLTSHATSLRELKMAKKLSIIRCPKLEALEGVPALLNLRLVYFHMETLPEYLRDVNPGRLELDCSLGLLTSVATVNTGLEWGKISHIQQVKAYAKDGDKRKGLYLLYKGDPNNIERNVRQYPDSEGKLTASYSLQQN
ncbi:hypothetical protein BAE44_0015843 [Dichanthelium oligosanthes]|uniref:Uncharacterized protein n=1 Tax=Dichanthelium oligosanthes TaxID=888268 RepID=A0A1E5VDB1_9POAL|nr:hypothetical protein BAE44_0015843 [Dichanthelium oligosanthes]